MEKIILTLPPTKISCFKCGILTEIRHNARTKYCLPCKAIAVKERRTRYFNKNRNKAEFKFRAKVNRLKYVSMHKERVIEAGKLISAKHNIASILWKDNIPEPNFNQIITFAIPFDWLLSKNSMKNYSQGHYYINDTARSAKEVIQYEIIKSKTKWIQSKVYIELFIEKPNQRGDAINFIDIIADGIVKGIGIDDRWFSIGRVDWQINKVNPKIWITIKQDTLNPLQACSHCGRLLTFNKFTIAKHAKNGIGRACIECRRTGRLMDKIDPRIEVEVL